MTTCPTPCAWSRAWRERARSRSGRASRPRSSRRSSRGSRFSRDRLGRVEAVSATGWSERYAYDAAGNVSRADAPEGPQGERVHDGTLIRRAGHITYVHDAQGRLVRQTRKLLSGGTREWTYATTQSPFGVTWKGRHPGTGRGGARTRVTRGATE
ncbi:hypothetical protein [Streptomyces sp. NPDC020571]|uniref:hypothetical protein n=1 Tax=Streptomyces sp. NPDC020571 TaxID=3365079 RepID=UPI00378F5CBA